LGKFIEEETGSKKGFFLITPQQNNSLS
jgi:hypothetical protein